MHYLYNCKRCKVGRRVEYTEYTRPVSRYDRGRWGRRDAGGVYVPAGAWITAIGGGRPTEYGGDPLGLCPKCGHLMTGKPVEGRVVESVPCDARCTGARGHTCDCSCGGKNHGKDWA